MLRVGKEGLIILGLLAGAALYFLLFSLQDINQTEIIGFRGQLQGEQFGVSRVWRDSPAELAGLKAGDVITGAGGKSTADWHRLFNTDRAAYHQQRGRLGGQPPGYQVLRDHEPLALLIIPREIRAAEIWTHYGFQIGLVLFLGGLAVFISLSNTSKQDAFLVSLCICFAIPWLASLEPYSPQFLSPLSRGASMPLVYFIKLLECFALMLVMSTLVHIALVFPEQRPVLKRHRWLLVPLYLAPPLILAIGMLLAGGDLLNRIAAVYLLRLVLTTTLLILATLLILFSYRHCDSPAQRERTRWIVVSMVIVAVSHLVCWNLPILFRGEPLIVNYDWLLVPLALIPLSMTLAITNHELFGIRGIIRGRLRLLEARLQKEQHMVISRDQRIRELGQEIDQLRDELQEYSLAERAASTGPEETPALVRLEERYPELATIRRERLISTSPLWEPVFEQAILAARGPAPVMIVGESGTGKTDLAWTIHRLGERRDAVFKAISCAQFEHADPAFALGRIFGIGTGHGLPNVPREGHRGLLEECDGGTLFLDDVDRLPLNVQDLLLYPLEGKLFEPGIGSGPARTVAVKFVFATNRDPDRLLSDGMFRADVLARIGTRIDIPPLRERPEDIPLLVEHFTRQVSRELGHEITIISTGTMKLLCRYSFAEGNARELMLEIQKAIGKAMLENDNVLRAGYLSDKLDQTQTRTQEPATASSDFSASRPASPDRNRVTEGVSRELAALRKYRFQIKPAEDELGLSHKSRTLSNHLRGICIRALCENDWSPQRAARALVQADAPAITVKLEGKMRRYLDNVRQNVRRGTERKLYNNLPVAYHDALNRAIARASTTAAQSSS
jgi:transcriptional regulator with AAA-type ATPase domain